MKPIGKIFSSHRDIRTSLTDSLFGLAEGSKTVKMGHLFNAKSPSKDFQGGGGMA